MKKLLILLMATAILVTGCGANTTQEDDNVLRVGIDLKYYPFMYLDSNGDPAGLEPDVAQAFGEYIGMEVELVNTDFTMLIPALDTGDVDIVISDMSIAPDRLEKVDFSDPYRYSPTLALVNKDFATANNITDDMSEEDFFAIEGFDFVSLAGTIAATIPYKHGVATTEFPEIATAIIEVSTGRADAIVGAYTVHGDHAANPETTIVYSGISDYSSSAFAVKKGNTELIEKANEFIATMYEEGGLYAEANGKYDAGIADFLKNDSLGLDYIIYPPQGN